MLLNMPFELDIKLFYCICKDEIMIHNILVTLLGAFTKEK